MILEYLKVDKYSPYDINDFLKNIVNKNNSNDANNANNAKTDTISVWTNEMESLFKGNHIVGLKNILKNNNLPVSGTKKILVKRIINAKIIYATTSLL